MRAIRIRRDAPIAEKVITPVFKREDLVYMKAIDDEVDLGFQLMRVVSVSGVGDLEEVEVAYIGNMKDTFTAHASELVKAPLEVVMQGARLYAGLALGLQHYIDAQDNDDVVRFALHRIKGEEVEATDGDEEDDDCEDDDDQGDEDIDEFDGRGYRYNTRGGI